MRELLVMFIVQLMLYKRLLTALALILAVLLAGCSTRSISDSGYKHDTNYRGELSELAVLGVTAGKDITEQDIQSALNAKDRIDLDRGDTIVLVQSGARFPDEAMMEEAEKYYRVIPVSGVPNNPREVSRSPYGEHVQYKENQSGNEEPLDKALRLAAARAGASTLIVYWGVLEIAEEAQATKLVSWVPIAGYVIPDESKEMRIRLKAAVIDVETGNWEMLTPEVYEDEALSALVNRASSHEQQVAALKNQAYRRLVADLQTRYE